MVQLFRSSDVLLPLSWGNDKNISDTDCPFNKHFEEIYANSVSSCLCLQKGALLKTHSLLEHHANVFIAEDYLSHAQGLWVFPLSSDSKQ